MPYVYKVETMPSGSAILTSWLNEQGAENWELVQAIPMSPINDSGNGSVLFYFKSGSA